VKCLINVGVSVCFDSGFHYIVRLIIRWSSSSQIILLMFVRAGCWKGPFQNAASWSIAKILLYVHLSSLFEIHNSKMHKCFYQYVRLKYTQ
jgi:hypothetical protein